MRKNRRAVLLIVGILILAVFLSGCSADSAFFDFLKAYVESREGTAPNTQQFDNQGHIEDGQGFPNQQPQFPQQQALGLNFVEFDGGCFTVMLPEGWMIQTMGMYTSFGFRAWDPQNPDYEIFYYGNIAPLNKSNEAKYGWAGYINNAGFPQAALYADAPAVNMDTASSVFYVFDGLQALSDKYGFGFSFPALDMFMPMMSVPMETSYSQIAAGEDLVFAGVRGSNGGACAGMFMASLWNSTPYYMDGIDMTPTAAMHVTGIIAPEYDFVNVEATLIESVTSLQFTMEYIQEAIDYSRRVGEAAMADNAARWAVFDRAAKAWSKYFRGGSTYDNLDDINNMLDNIKNALDNIG
ncbi:MAG: hypothetical protein GX222_08005 [Ruminococcaceae bacterium]|nr:hypothetical protein [Oscillospiraceae bacterium]